MKTSQPNYERSSSNDPQDYTPPNVFNPFNSYNQERYQYKKTEQISYTWTGPITRSVDLDTVPPSTLNLDNTARVFFMARVPITVTKIMATWGTSDSAAYLQVQKLVDGEAPGILSGFSLLPDPFDCTEPANYTYRRDYTQFVLSNQVTSLDMGDRLAIVFAITPDTLADLTVLVEYQYQN